MPGVTPAQRLATFMIQVVLPKLKAGEIAFTEDGALIRVPEQWQALVARRWWVPWFREVA